MGYTKRQIVEGALGEIGLGSYAFDLLPEQREAALRRLDSLMAELNGRGVRLSYPLPDSPGSSDIDADSGIPDYAIEAAITNLALRISPSYGKTVSAETKATARHALNTALARAAMPREMQMTSLPAGAGNKSLDEPFTPEPDLQQLVVGPDAILDFN